MVEINVEHTKTVKKKQFSWSTMKFLESNFRPHHHHHHHHYQHHLHHSLVQLWTRKVFEILKMLI